MNTLKLDKVPFLIDGKQIERIEATPLGFKATMDVQVRVGSKGLSQDEYASAQRMEQFAASFKMIDSNGQHVAFTGEHIRQMPRCYAAKLLPLLEDQNAKAGKVLSDKDADGATSPVIYQLGTPIPVADGKSITELEFIAPLYGDVEDVLAEVHELMQALVLIQKVADPIGSPLMRLPSWAVDAITLADGITIAKTVLPRFLE